MLWSIEHLRDLGIDTRLISILEKALLEAQTYGLHNLYTRQYFHGVMLGAELALDVALTDEQYELLESFIIYLFRVDQADEETSLYERYCSLFIPVDGGHWTYHWDLNALVTP